MTECTIKEAQKLREELGDVLWYIACLASAFDLSMQEIAQANVEKLEKRYPSGYSDRDALARADKGGIDAQD